MSPEQRDAENARRRAHRAANLDMYRARERAKYSSNPSVKKESSLRYHERHPERRKEINRRAYQKNREARIAKAALYAASHPDTRRRASMTAHWKRAKDPKYRLHRAVSAHIGYSLNGAKQGQGWESIVGYSCVDLMAHIERQFQLGMTWENYGEWHIDHIVPASSFSFASPTDDGFKACWALTNLRPLWASENIAKRDRRELLL